jgi:putative flippase GtrA
MEDLKRILRDKDHAGLQFLKYVVCGGIAFAVDYMVFNLSAIRLFPALQPDDFIARFLGLSLEPIDAGLRLRNYWICMSVGFICSNTVAYVTNVLFVFKPGKHKVHHEVALFFGISLLAFLLSTVTGDMLIRFFEAQTSVSKLVAIVFAVLINYSGRKFLIFHG